MTDTELARTFSIHYAKTHLSRLIEKAARGEAFIIARAGKPLVKVVSLDTSTQREINPIGFMKGRIKIPDDFDRMYVEEIARLFEGGV
jgi:prevent-host-death family protein